MLFRSELGKLLGAEEEEDDEKDEDDLHGSEVHDPMLPRLDPPGGKGYADGWAAEAPGRSAGR